MKVTNRAGVAAGVVFVYTLYRYITQEMLLLGA